MMLPTVLLWMVVAYLCGSIPFALLLGKWRGVDVRMIGSGNVGATNLGRALGRKWGVLCFVLDMLKGLVPVAAAGLALGYFGRWDLPASDLWRWLAVAIMPVLGHMFPVWLGFRGGKGVSTGRGVVLGVFPLLTLAGLAAGVVWFIALKLWRMMSLASMIGAWTMPLCVLLLTQLKPQTRAGLAPLLTVTITMAALVTIRHRANIVRIVAGKESKL